MLGGRCCGRLHEQLAAHPEVSQDGRSVIQRQPEVFAASSSAGDDPTGQTSGEILRAEQMTANGSRVEDPHRLNVPTDHKAFEPSSYDLNFRELWHRWAGRPHPEIRLRGSARRF